MDSNELGQVYKPPKKSFFFGRRKRKPICTCHLYQAALARSAASESIYDPAQDMNYQDANACHQDMIAYSDDPPQQPLPYDHHNSLAPPHTSCSPMCYSTTSTHHHHHHHLFPPQNVPGQFDNRLPGMFPNGYSADQARLDETGVMARQHGYHPNAMLTYSPDLSQCRKLYDTNDEFPNTGSHQRRWSDSTAQFSLVEQDYMQMAANHNQSLEPKPTRPKVSFGPSQMYPIEVEMLQQHEQQEAELKKQNLGLTTELLPLDAHFSLQMMPETGFMCTII